MPVLASFNARRGENTKGEEQLRQESTIEVDLEDQSWAFFVQPGS